MVIIYSMQQPPLINGPPAGSALQRDAVVVRRFSKCVIDYKPQSSSLQPTNPTASLMVSLVTVFSQLFVGEVLRIFGSWQTATTAAAALFFFFMRFLRITVIALQWLALGSVSWLPDGQLVPGRARLPQAGQSRAEQKTIPHPFCCMFSWVLRNIWSELISDHWCHCWCWRTFYFSICLDKSWKINDLQHSLIKLRL